MWTITRGDRTLEQSDESEARLARARAWHNLGRPVTAVAAMPPLPDDPEAIAEWEELTVLLAAEQVLADAPTRLPVPGRLHPWEEPLVTARVYLRLRHLDAARQALVAVHAAIGDAGAPRVRAQAEFVDALVSFYRGEHGRLQAQLRRLADQDRLGTSTVWQHARVVEALARSAWDEAEQLLQSMGGDNAYGTRPMRAWVAVQLGDPRSPSNARWLRHHELPRSLETSSSNAGSTDIGAPMGSGKVSPSSHSTASKATPPKPTYSSSAPFSRTLSTM